MVRNSEEAVPWLECWAAESRAVTLKAGPAVRSLWSTDRKEAWVTAAAKTGGRKEEMYTHTHKTHRWVSEDRQQVSAQIRTVKLENTVKIRNKSVERIVFSPAAGGGSRKCLFTRQTTRGTSTRVCQVHTEQQEIHHKWQVGAQVRHSRTQSLINNRIKTHTDKGWKDIDIFCRTRINGYINSCVNTNYRIAPDMRHLPFSNSSSWNKRFLILEAFSLIKVKKKISHILTRSHDRQNYVLRQFAFIFLSFWAPHHLWQC